MKVRVSESIIRGMCSVVLRGLAKGRPISRENLYWSIWTRYFVYCWCSSNHVPFQINLMIDCLLCDIVTKDGMWNLELFRAGFLKDIDKRVVSIPLTTLRLVLIKSIGCAPR
ncbi:hypothetical protein Gogos_020487 [Gossypium gossypioides]|uniref:Uncharacterized protein n=1 Tax=Gossypium gossypioides TaxID=34282 RepID=A0A7J9D6V4_GOSGO|nr:hypothetical protein [Gossypium gossypioides]